MREGINEPKPLPEPNVDLYELANTLPADELITLQQVREFMRSEVAPVINKYWAEDAFLFELLPGLKRLDIIGAGMNGYECRGGSALLFGLIEMELARFDASIAMFVGVHT